MASFRIRTLIRRLERIEVASLRVTLAAFEAIVIVSLILQPATFSIYSCVFASAHTQQQQLASLSVNPVQIDSVNEFCPSRSLFFFIADSEFCHP
jgi:hypothetical protein